MIRRSKKWVWFLLVASLLCGILLLAACDGLTDTRADSSDKKTETKLDPSEANTEASSTPSEETQENAPLDRVTPSGLKYRINPDGKTCTVMGIVTCRDTEILIPEAIDQYAVTSIGRDAFRSCTCIVGIAIPNSVTSIGADAFFDCGSIERVYMASPEAWCAISFENSYSNPLCYDAMLYWNNESLTEIEIPNTVTQINDYTFYGCQNLIGIVIPNSVTRIGKDVFRNCNSLQALYYGGTASDWAKISIGSYNYDLTNATIYYYSETQPTTEGSYWRYVDGVPTAW